MLLGQSGDPAGTDDGVVPGSLCQSHDSLVYSLSSKTTRDSMKNLGCTYITPILLIED